MKFLSTFSGVLLAPTKYVVSTLIGNKMTDAEKPSLYIEEDTCGKDPPDSSELILCFLFCSSSILTSFAFLPKAAESSKASYRNRSVKQFGSFKKKIQEKFKILSF